MDALINWARNLSYDLTAILLPGAVTIVVLAGTLDLAGHVNVNETVLDITRNDAQSVSKILVMILSSYLAGTLLKALSGLQPIKWLFRLNLPSHSLDDVLLKKAMTNLSEELALDKPLKDWKEFYVLAKNYVQEHGTHSSLVTYQNGYDMHANMSVGLIICAFFSLALYCGTDRVWLLVFASLLLIFAILFTLNYRKYWIVFGDHVISHMLLLPTHNSHDHQDI